MTSAAFSVRHVRVVDWPASMVVGFAEIEAVGAAGGGGGCAGALGGGFLQAPTASITAKVLTSNVNFILLRFNV
jgi:hypothetical protein